MSTTGFQLVDSALKLLPSTLLELFIIHNLIYKGYKL